MEDPDLKPWLGNVKDGREKGRGSLGGELSHH